MPAEWDAVIERDIDGERRDDGAGEQGAAVWSSGRSPPRGANGFSGERAGVGREFADGAKDGVMRLAPDFTSLRGNSERSRDLDIRIAESHPRM